MSYLLDSTAGEDTHIWLLKVCCKPYLKIKRERDLGELEGEPEVQKAIVKKEKVHD